MWHSSPKASANWLQSPAMMRSRKRDGGSSGSNIMEDIKKLIKSGSAITGGAAGAAAGATLAGPLGAIPGAAAGTASGILAEQVFEVVGNEFAARVLGLREKNRIGATIIYARNAIRERFAAGEQLRNDGFFSQPQPPNPACLEIPFIERPPADEIIEGALLAAQREHEEKKLPFVSNLLTSILFDPNIDKMQANLMIKISSNITYTQLCILRIFRCKENFPSLRDGNYRGGGQLGFKLISLLEEISDLWNQGILNCSGKANLSLTDVNPSKMNVQGIGVLLYNSMKLEKIDENDVKSVVSLLSLGQNQEQEAVQDVNIYGSEIRGLRNWRMPGID
jgi:hypothetical protein